MSISDNHARGMAGARPFLASLRHPLALTLLLGLLLRALLWGSLPRTGLISDEGEYLSAASWLAQGRGFDWYQGYLWTRAPLYPLLAAAHLALFGTAAALFVTQAALSLLNVALVYALARRLLPGGHRAAASLAALLAALYFPFATYPQILLSETLFITLVLGAFLALGSGEREAHGVTRTMQSAGPTARSQQRELARRWRFWPLVLAGALLGMATLVRSLALGFVPLAALWLWWVQRRSRAGVTSALAFALAAGAVVLPWTLANSRMYGGLVLVDTSGAFNLLLGARTAHDGRREDAQVRDFVLGLLGQAPASDPAADACAPYPGALPTQAARQAAMTREALCLIAARPAAFAQKSLAELIDLFQINYTGAERFAGGFTTGRLPRWYTLGLFLLDDTLYVLALPLGVLGWAHTRRMTDHRRRTTDSGRQAHGCFGHRSVVSLVGLWWLYNLAAAPLLFAINRFRLPLMPFVFLFAAYAVCEAARLIPRRHTGAKDPQAEGRRAGAPAGLRDERTPLWYALTGLLAGLLWLVAATPHAYLEPRAPGAPSRWASYLGPYPSSLAISRIALQARPRAAGDAAFDAALRAGDAAAAAAVLRERPVSDETARLGPALIAARTGRPDDTLALLPPSEQITATGDALAAVLRGDALRTLGDEAGARAAFTPRFVDDANPVDWAWERLRPAPTRWIDLGGNLDIGYIAGCYLGEGDAAERTTYRWCTDGVRLRFPGAGTGQPQQLALRADGRGWPADMRPHPPVRVLVGGREVGAFTPDTGGPREFTLELPAAPAGSDVVITLRGATFVPGPERFLRQQSEASLGQVQRLAVRLDWAELR